MVTVLLVIACVLASVGLLWRYQRKIAPPLADPLADPQVVQAVFTAASHKRVEVAAQIEAAMARAVAEHMAHGRDLNDSETLRAAMLDARNRVLGR